MFECMYAYACALNVCILHVFVLLCQRPRQLNRHKSSIISRESLDSETFWK